jgi:hypothetical protein
LGEIRAAEPDLQHFAGIKEQDDLWDRFGLIAVWRDGESHTIDNRMVPGE